MLVSDSKAASQVSQAVEAGYRVLDTAQRCENEAGIGKGLAQSGLPRQDFFVATKVWLNNMVEDPTEPAWTPSPRRVFDSVCESIRKLGLEYLDLVMPQWPGKAQRGAAPEFTAKNAVLRRETWRALEELQSSGRVRALGVSNYNARHMVELLGFANTRPSIAQMEVHPYNAQADLVRYYQGLGMQVMAHSPLGGSGIRVGPGGARLSLKKELLTDPVLQRIGRAHAKTPAQVVLRWHLQRGVVPVPRARSAAHMQQNRDVFDFELTPKDMGDLASLDRQQFVVLDPENYP